MFSATSILTRFSMAAVLVTASSLAFSQANLTIGSDVASSPGTATVTLDFTNDGTQTSITADIAYDSTFVNPQTTGVNVDGCLASLPPAIGGLFTSCRETSPGNIRIVLTAADAVSVMPDAPAFGTITFDVAGGATPGQAFPLDGTSFDTTPGTAADLTVTDGQITIQVPAGQSFYSSTPAIGGAVDFGSAVVNSATAVQAIAVVNLQDDGTNTFDITDASGTSAGANIAVTAPVLPGTVTIPADGGVTTQNVNFECTPTARGAQTGTLTITNDSSNAGPAADYTFTCDGLAPNVNVTGPTPDPMNGLTTDPSAPTATITATNPDDGFTSTANNVTAVAGAGDAAITVTTAGPTSIAAGGTFDFVIECSNAAAGVFQRTIDITWDDPISGGTATDSVTANCEILDEFPTYVSVPAAGTPVNFGVVANGTTAGPVQVDVWNDGNGTGPASELVISSATITGPDAAAYTVTSVNTNPIPVSGGPDGNFDVEFTCTPPPGSDGVTLNATLEIVHNDAPNSPATHALTCTGATDAVFGSTPGDGGTLNLGTVPPATITPPGDIVFSNTGAVDSYGVECTVTDPDGVFSFSPDPISLTIPAGGSDSASFQCSPSAPGIFQATVDCAINGADVVSSSYTLTCQGQPLVIPTLDRWGLLLMALAVLALGGFAGRRMMTA